MNKDITVTLLALAALLQSCAPQPNSEPTEQTKKIVFPDDPEYLNWQLSRFELEALHNDGDIRFLWLRSFHDPIVFELKGSENGRLYTARVWHKNRWKTYSKKELKEEDDRFLKIADLKFTGFFDAPNFKKEDLRYTDGASWIFEATTRGKHHWIYKQSPSEETNEERWGRQLIEASIDSPAVPIY